MVLSKLANPDTQHIGTKLPAHSALGKPTARACHSGGMSSKHDISS
jgi:hypothetical protein